MKSFRSIFLISLVLLSVSIGVFAHDYNIQGTTDDTHAHWYNEDASAEDYTIPLDDKWYTIIPNLNVDCDSHEDHVMSNPTIIGDCVDDEFEIKAQNTQKSQCRLGSSGESTTGNKKLMCKGITVSEQNIEVSGYPTGAPNHNNGDRRASDLIKIIVEAVPEPTAEPESITATSSGPKVYAQGSCSGGTGDYNYSIPTSGEPDKGTANISTSSGLITYTPAANSAGNYDLTYQCKDENDKSDTALVTIIVASAGNPIPIWDDIPDSKGEMVEDENKYLFELDNFCSDPGETGIQNDRSYSIISETQKDIVDCQLTDIDYVTSVGTSKWLYCEPKEDKSGTSVVTIQCKESSGLKQKAVPNAIVNVDVSSVYDAISVPAITSITVQEDVPISGVIDVDVPEEGTIYEASFEFTILTHDTPSVLSTLTRPDENSPNFVYTPQNQFTGTDTWSYQVKDTGNGQILSNKKLNFTVVNVADAPSIYGSIQKTILEDNPLVFNSNWFTAVFEDDDYEDSLEKIRITIPEDMNGYLYSSTDTIGTETTISKNNINHLIFEPHPDENNALNYASFEFTVIDQSGYPSLLSETFTIKVTPEQDAPTLMFTELVWINSDTLETVTIDEDESVIVDYTTEDVDGEVLGISAKSSNEDLVLSSSLIPTLTELELIPIAGAFGTTTITVYLTDGTDTISTSFDLEVLSVNDIPESQNFSTSIFEYGTYTFDPDNFAFSDLDVVDVIQNIEILTLPTGGQLKLDSVVYTEELLETGITIPTTQIPNLAFVSEYGFLDTTSFSFKVGDGTDYSQAHLFSITVQPSLYGPNSHPARLGGFPIYNTGWACKPGFNLKAEFSVLPMVLESAVDACEQTANTLPIANISISVERAPFGSAIFFSGEGSVDEEGPIQEYIWELSPSITKNGSTVNHIYTSETDCPSIGCSIKLTVIDTNGENSTATKILTLGGTETTPDYSSLTMIEGQNYADDELAHLGLNKGQMNFRNGQEITVDSSGKITQILKYEGNSENKESYMEGDGICSESLGEHSSNSPNDCEGDSKTGALLLLAFLTILGGGAFFAWKKGLLGKHNLSLGAKPTSDASPFETTQPVQPAQPTGPNQYIKTQRSKGFSNEQIRGALKNKGWSDDKIDEALNASRE